MIVYKIGPIDHWNGWHEPSDLFRALSGFGDCEWLDPADWERSWNKAQKLALQLGWDGDIRTGPFVTVLPDQDGSTPPFLIGWKQDNNGTVFVASPLHLPWLEVNETEWAEG